MRTHSSDATTGPCDQDCLPNEACGVENGHYSDGARYLWIGKKVRINKKDGEQEHLAY